MQVNKYEHKKQENVTIDTALRNKDWRACIRLRIHQKSLDPVPESAQLFLWDENPDLDKI